jgi:hypothetical protein
MSMKSLRISEPICFAASLNDFCSSSIPLMLFEKFCPMCFIKSSHFFCSSAVVFAVICADAFRTCPARR